MADEQVPESSLITVFVKTPKEKLEIKINQVAIVKELKESISEKLNAPMEQLCLIFAGKVLKDCDSLLQHNIKDGMTVHLVIKSGSSGPSTHTQPDVTATPFGLGSFGGMAGMSNIGMGSANFLEMQQRMQQQVMQHPEMLGQMLENPFVQQLMSNTDVMRQLMMANPQMRDLMERNPEVTHMLNNPELMRQTLELAKNPAMLQEVMRSQDRAMSNLESIPGGFNALQRMYTNIQEPMMNAAQEGLGSNPFAGLAGSSSPNTQTGRENTAPLPNPWASISPSPGLSPTTTPTSSGPASTGMYNTPGMASLWSHMSDNPQLIHNMLQAPYMEAMMESMAANPELANQILGSNPLLANNPQLREHFHRNLPQMVQQMQNPAIQSVMTNPRAFQAMQHVMQGMQTLQAEAPELFPGFGLAGGNFTLPPGMGTASSMSGFNTSGSTDSTTAPTSPAVSSVTSATTSTTNTTSATGLGCSATNTLAPGVVDPFTRMMTQMMGMITQGTINQPVEQRYSSELDQLFMMGFLDRPANIRALQATCGDLNMAIERLLQQR